MIDLAKNLIISMRPKQWVKNLFLFAAIIFVKQFFDIEKLATVFEAFIIFCLAGSAIYLLNDVVDAPYDRRHPQKRLRPIASGELPESAAVFAAVVFGALSIFWSFYINNFFALTVVGFLALNVLYSFYLKRFVIIDVITIALGFVIRVIAGAVAINVRFSEWLILATFFLTLFLAISKRKNELMHAEEAEAREGLGRYSLALLDQMNAIVLPSTIITYAFYTFSSEHSKLLMITIPIVLYGLFRYLFLINIKTRSDDGPTDDLLSDKNLTLTVFIWLAVSAAIILYAG
ncbi:hypothetical protein A2661_00560 [Candidatus Giovannonibacteria bacterium RIFCSPHIGHO2_01_FULL_45_24]|uniref:Phosphoribose diphosphate--decaprenyl-phosphate phosphoribosyltransferase n=1 Tax=Candidatus Giovannonibacteria bacterium RIFCSPLOWO2_01_FULL_46_32 TaxID=1798353 RepID=A0A1F5XGS7_9BACT|nr:MAG: hypothetical protein A2661_00560 [Candidatus Giovannonibacteria bacterium RIFCSPHIGHO2_01_FULL_45_24]OGF87069.1 MAG: hypothetical protein A3B19_01400 [Candidatus Giovannonibacteria bacterium RIFCSPLOWO2_01_FULL_46_32]